VRRGIRRFLANTASPTYLTSPPPAARRRKEYLYSLRRVRRRSPKSESFKKISDSKQLIPEHSLANSGKGLQSKGIQHACGGAAEWSRRVRELRNEEGYQILSHKDRRDLKPGQYILETTERVPAFRRGISKETRAQVLERNGYTCQMCGVAAGDPDPLGGPRPVRLTIGHIKDKSKGGDDSPQNLRAICDSCNEGLQNTAPPKPDRIHLLSQVRRATIDDQQALLDWLSKKFGPPHKNPN